MTNTQLVTYVNLAKANCNVVALDMHDGNYMCTRVDIVLDHLSHFLQQITWVYGSSKNSR